MFKAKKRRALSAVVTGAILLSAVSVMGLMIVAWANSNLQTHQAELDKTFADNHNKINERITVEHMWFDSSGPLINITMSNTGTLGLNVTEIKAQNMDTGQIQGDVDHYSNAGIPSGGDMSFNRTLVSLISGDLYEVTITTNRGNIFKAEAVAP